jgi:hypothetical protein
MCGSATCHRISDRVCAGDSRVAPAPHIIATTAIVGKVLFSFCSFSTGLLGRAFECSATLVLLCSNNSWGDGSVIRRSQNDNLRADLGAVVKIDNVIVSQADAAG